MYIHLLTLQHVFLLNEIIILIFFFNFEAKVVRIGGYEVLACCVTKLEYLNQKKKN